jgi:hypothetical protein
MRYSLGHVEPPSHEQVQRAVGIYKGEGLQAY